MYLQAFDIQVSTCTESLLYLHIDILDILVVGRSVRVPTSIRTTLAK